MKKKQIIKWLLLKGLLLKISIVSFGILITILSSYVTIAVLGIIGTIFIFSVTMVWGFKGGALSVIWLIIIMGYSIVNSTVKVNPSFIISGTVLYLFIGIVLGRLLDLIRCQREDLSRLVHTLKQQEKILTEKEEHYHLIFDSIGDAVFIFNFDKDNKLKIIEVNSYACCMLGYTREELLKLTCCDIVSENYQAKINTFEDLLRQNEELSFEITYKTKQSQLIPVECHCISFEKNQEKFGICAARNISERKKAEQEIIYLTFHDYLTKLFNRSFLEIELERLDTGRQLPLSIIMADMNGIKLVNDAFGHFSGDKLLIQLANILKENCRQEDIIARWGGDEFVVALPQTSREETLQLVKRIKSACKNSHHEPIPLSVSVGVATKTIEEQNIYQILQEAENHMYKEKLKIDKTSRSEIIASLKHTLWEMGQETEIHTLRLQILCDQMCKKMELPVALRNELQLLAALHDIGKIAIPQSILIKPTKLTGEEWELIKKHPEIGYRIALSSFDVNVIAQGILSHHERWDGTGYPQGLKKNEISLTARIISIVDAYDVMVSGRNYQQRISKEEAIEEIKRAAGTQFDPEIVDMFLEIIKEDHK